MENSSFDYKFLVPDYKTIENNAEHMEIFGVDGIVNPFGEIVNTIQEKIRIKKDNALLTELMKNLNEEQLLLVKNLAQAHLMEKYNYNF